LQDTDTEDAHKNHADSQLYRINTDPRFAFDEVVKYTIKIILLNCCQLLKNISVDYWHYSLTLFGGEYGSIILGGKGVRRARGRVRGRALFRYFMQFEH
jgi:hypothetical protein